MPRPRHSRVLVRTGRAVCLVIIVGLVAYMFWVGFDRASKLGSAIAGVVALVALVAPYLIPQSSGGTSLSTQDIVDKSGAAHATDGGLANTGVQGVADDRPVHISGSGDATAHGAGSVANTGVQRGPQ